MLQAADKVNAYGTSALYEAVWHGKQVRAANLLENGADPNFRTVSPQPRNLRGRTPLYADVLTENPEMVELLLAHGADPDLAPDLTEDPRTPLMNAVLTGNPRIVKPLLAAGADPNLLPEGYQTTILPPASNGPAKNSTNVRLLLEHGADPLLILRGEHKGKTVEATVLALVAGYRYSWNTRDKRDRSDGWLHQLMLEHVRRQGNWDRLDDTMKWQGKGCYGYVVERTDRKLSIIARKVYGDADRWPELATLNAISRDKPYRMGDCLKVFDVAW